MVCFLTDRCRGVKKSVYKTNLCESLTHGLQLLKHLHFVRSK